MKIKFSPTGQEIDVDPNKSLLQLCTDNQIEIRSICKGVPSCAECRVRIVSGENNVLPPSQAELSLIGTSYFLDGRRLSCQVRCFGNITVDLTEQIERQDNPNKKVRGFRSTAQKTVETQAVQGTLVLEEKPQVQAQPQQQQPRREESHQQQNRQQEGGGAGGGGGNRNRRNRNRRGGGRGGGGGGQGKKGDA